MTIVLGSHDKIKVRKIGKDTDKVKEDKEELPALTVKRRKSVVELGLVILPYLP